MGRNWQTWVHANEGWKWDHGSLLAHVSLSHSGFHPGPASSPCPLFRICYCPDLHKASHSFLTTSYIFHHISTSFLTSCLQHPEGGRTLGRRDILSSPAIYSLSGIQAALGHAGPKQRRGPNIRDSAVEDDCQLSVSFSCWLPLSYCYLAETWTSLGPVLLYVVSLSDCSDCALLPACQHLVPSQFSCFSHLNTGRYQYFST